MIQVESICIKEFRGIRSLALTFNLKSFIVWGPNGSGKSGVVDAIDFALTGRISRLSGPGTGTVTVLKHGPHVHKRDDAGAAEVELKIRDTASGQTGVLTRSVKTSSFYTLNPDTAELRAAVERAREHPELVLSRREIIKYILTEPGSRAQEIQALLKLDRIDQIRKLLVAARNKTTVEFDRADSDLSIVEKEICRHLEVPSLSSDEMLRVINMRRSVLGLNLLTEVFADTPIGTTVQHGGPAFNKVSAIRDVRSLSGIMKDPGRLVVAATELTATLDELSADPDILSALQHRNLVTVALPLVTGAFCPLCDRTWDDIQGLRAHLQEKLQRSNVADLLEKRILGAASSIKAELRSCASQIQNVQTWAITEGAGEIRILLERWNQDITEFIGSLSTVSGAAEQRHRINNNVLLAPSQMAEHLTDFEKALQAKPDQTATVNAQTFLAVCQDKWKRVVSARARHAEAKAARKTAITIYETYTAVADAALANLYRSIEDNFGAYYRLINSDDEPSFKAELGPSAGKLDFRVDFYGIGMFPPAAYHSEGHQDGMGVCLYLALMRQILGDDFRFAVLDDVVMSVDRSHRRQFCRLLREEFSDVQFIITTHDEVWARQMQSDGLIGRKSQARFHGWTVDNGPIYEQGGDIWSRAEGDLANDDASGAAHKLRRYLESVMTDLAESLRASVPYRPEPNYDLGELMNAVNKRHGELLGIAADAANSWKSDSAKQRVQDLKAQRAKAIPAQQNESWAINKLVHNNDWTQLGRTDIEPIIDACRQLLELFRCDSPDCESFIYVSVQAGKEESLRCACGSYNLNLRKK